MADLEGLKVSKDYHVNVPFANQEGFFLKGINSLDWGMKKRMSNIFDPKSGNTVMFAFDHGYFMGSTSAHLRPPRDREERVSAGHLRFLHAPGRSEPRGGGGGHRGRRPYGR